MFDLTSNYRKQTHIFIKETEFVIPGLEDFTSYFYKTFK